MKSDVWIAKHRSRVLFVAAIVLLAALSLRFFNNLWRLDVPMGYDPGIYRYLFLLYGDYWPPFTLPDLLPWAQEYPYGLFIFSSLLLKTGLPVDWLLGWMWSLWAVVLLMTLAWVFARREGPVVGILVLLCGYLSLAYYDGYAAMYWKTYFSLFFLVLTFHFFERRSAWMILTGALCILSHNQTALILGASLGMWWLYHLPTQWNNPMFRRITIAFALVAVLGFIWYLPHWYRSFWAPVKSIIMLRGDRAPAGGFGDATHYFSDSGILLDVGLLGLFFNLRRERGTLWQFAVLVCAIFIVGKLVFYKRFFLQFDFFLLPFAAMAIRQAWNYWSDRASRIAIFILIAIQVWISTPVAFTKGAGISSEEFAALRSIPSHVSEDATVIALENVSAVWLLGWVPELRTGGPGLFDFPDWRYSDWELLLYGSNDARRDVLDAFPYRPLYFMTTNLFFNYYGSSVDGFLSDPCVRPVSGAPLLEYTCPPRSS